jgi:hypothetical protein
VPFDTQSLFTIRTLSLGFDQGGSLLLYKVRLTRRQELFCFSQRQAEVCDALAGLVEDCYLMHRVFLTIFGPHDELHLTPWGHPPVRVIELRWPMVPLVSSICPSFLMVSSPVVNLC